MKILIIEDEANIVQLIRLYLKQANFTVLTASDGVAGLELHAREHPDLVILDLMLPALDGMEVCRRIRSWASTPILMLTARQGEEDRIAGLELGADDYLVKPFSPRELVSRVKAILRRSQSSGDNVGAPHIVPSLGAQFIAPSSTLSTSNFPISAVTPSNVPQTSTSKATPNTEERRFGNLIINIPGRRVEVNGQRVNLTVKEFDLLVTLSAAPERVFTREVLLNQVWGYTYLGDGRTVDVHIGTLRKKIEAIAGAPHYIKTVWGVGYKFTLEDQE